MFSSKHGSNSVRLLHLLPFPEVERKLLLHFDRWDFFTIVAGVFNHFRSILHCFCMQLEEVILIL